MKLRKFLSLLVIIMGIVSAYFLARGIIVLSPEKMLNEMPHYSAMSWPSHSMILSKAAQKANMSIGFLSLFFTLIFQIINFIFGNKTCIAKRKGIVLLIVIVSALLTIFLISEKMIYNHNQLEMKRLSFQKYCGDKFADKKIESNSFQAISREYFKLEKRTSENNIEFIKRVAKYAGWVITDEDFSKMPKEWLRSAH